MKRFWLANAIAALGLLILTGQTNHPGTGRPSAPRSQGVIIAAVDASDSVKRGADFICPPTDCTAQMQAAVAEAYRICDAHTNNVGSGVEVNLSSGTFNIQDSIVLSLSPANKICPIHFKGQGMMQTYLIMDQPTTCNSGNGCYMFTWDDADAVTFAAGYQWTGMWFEGCQTGGCTAGGAIRTENLSDPGNDLADVRVFQTAAFDHATAAFEVTTCWGVEFTNNVIETSQIGVWIHEPRIAVSASGWNTTTEVITFDAPHGLSVNDIVVFRDIDVTTDQGQINNQIVLVTEVTSATAIKIKSGPSDPLDLQTITDGNGTGHHVNAGTDCQFVSNKIMGNDTNDILIENAELVKLVGNAFGHSQIARANQSHVIVREVPPLEADSNVIIGNTFQLQGTNDNDLNSALFVDADETIVAGNNFQCNFTITSDVNNGLLHIGRNASDVAVSGNSYMIDTAADCPVKMKDEGLATHDTGIDGKGMMSYDPPNAGVKSILAYDDDIGSAVWVPAFDGGLLGFSPDWTAHASCEVGYIVGDTTSPLDNECDGSAADTATLEGNVTCATGGDLPPGTPTSQVRCEFDGTTDDIEVTRPYTNDLESSPRTVMCWFEEDVAAQDYLIFMDGVNGLGYSLLSEADGTLDMWTGGTNNEQTTATTSTGVWSHVAAVSGSAIGFENRVYLDGNNVCTVPLRCGQDSSGVADPLDPTADGGAAVHFSLGGNFAGAFSLDGRMTECFSFSRIFTEQEICGVVRCGISGDIPDRGIDCDMGGYQCRYSPVEKMNTLPTCGAEFEGVILADDDGAALCYCDGTGWQALGTGTCS